MTSPHYVSRALRRVISKIPPPRDDAARRLVVAGRDLISGRASPKSGDLGARVEVAFATNDDARIRALLTECHALRERIERLASPPGTPKDVRLSRTSGTQSLQFMIDALPHLQKYLAEYRRGSCLDVLDVGPGTGLGTALLAALYADRRLGYRMNVSALDIDDRYRHYISAITPMVEFIHDDLFSHAGTYDISIASHVIEHVPDAEAFCRRLQEVTRGAVFIVAPFNEPIDNLTKGHVRTIDKALVERIEPEWWTTVHSVSWGAFLDPPYKMLIARLPGKA